MPAAPVLPRRFAPADAPDLRLLADDREVARWTAALPHPYTEGMAEAWIAGHADARACSGERAQRGEPHAFHVRGIARDAWERRARERLIQPLRPRPFLQVRAARRGDVARLAPRPFVPGFPCAR